MLNLKQQMAEGNMVFEAIPKSMKEMDQILDFIADEFETINMASYDYYIVKYYRGSKRVGLPYFISKANEDKTYRIWIELYNTDEDIKRLQPILADGNKYAAYVYMNLSNISSVAADMDSPFLRDAKELPDPHIKLNV